MVDGPPGAEYPGAFSSTVLARSTAGTEPFVATLMASTPRVSSRAAGTFTAGQVIPADVAASSGPANPSSGNAAAGAPAGQRPRAGTDASCAHEITPAGIGTDGPAPKVPRLSKVPGRASPGSARTTATPWTPGVRRNWATSDAAGAAGPAPAAVGSCADVNMPDAASWSVTTAAAAGVADVVTFLASCVVMLTTATVVTNRASTRPLTARKAALGSSARRRAAISAPGWLVRRARTLAAAMVSHGPAMTRRTIMSRKPDRSAQISPPTEVGVP